MSQKLIARVGESEVNLDLQEAMQDHSILEVEPGVYSVLVASGRSLEVRIHGKAKSAEWTVDVAGRAVGVEIRDPRQRSSRAGGGAASGRQQVCAPMPGKVIRVLIAEGDAVEAGQGLVVVEAMKMQNEMKSPKAGTVAQVMTQSGATVAVGDVLVVIE